MDLIIGHIKSDAKIAIKSFQLNQESLDYKLVDSDELKDHSFNLLITPTEQELGNIEEALNDERKFYPIVESQDLGIDFDSFESADASTLQSIYKKVSTRWILQNNIQTVEQSYSLIKYLRDLWTSDRNNLFEELWFLLKMNLATTKLAIVFHDVQVEAQKPELYFATVEGHKIPNIRKSTGAEEELIQNYESDYAPGMNITEYDNERGRLVITAKIGSSPILIMAELASLNQLQKAILTSIFTGLAEDN